MPYSVDQIYTAIAGAMNVRYRPFHIPLLLCGCINLVDRIMGRCGRLHPTIHAAGKFYFDIAGDATAAQRDFGFDAQMQLEDAAREFACEFTGKATKS